MPMPESPDAGFYATKLVKGGPEVACRIICSEGWWLCLVNGLPTSETAEREPFRVPRMERIASSRPISENAYEALLDAAAAAKPGEPLADPTAAVDWRRAPPLY